MYCVLNMESPLREVPLYIYLSRAYLNVPDCGTHIHTVWPKPMALGRVHVWNVILCDIPERDPPRTYVCTYICTS